MKYQIILLFLFISLLTKINAQNINVGISNVLYEFHYTSTCSSYESDTLSFWASLYNVGDDLVDLVIRVEVQSRYEDGEVAGVLFSSEINIDTLHSGLVGGDVDQDGVIDTAFYFDEEWIPGIIGLGDYYIEYSLHHSQLEEDGNQSDHQKGYSFVIELEYNNALDTVNTFLRKGGDGNFAIGRFLKTNDLDIIDYVGPYSHISFSVSVDTQDSPISQYFVQAYYLKIQDSIGRDMSKFKLEEGFLENPAFEEIVGFAQYIYEGNGTHEEVHLQLMDFEGNNIELEDSSYYMIVIEQMGKEVKHGFNEGGFEYWQTSTVAFFDDKWDLNGLGADKVADIGFFLLPTCHAVSTHEEINAMPFILYPNPSHGEIAIEIKEDISNELIYRIFNATGGIVKNGEISNTEKKIIHINDAGIYYIEMRSKNLVNTKRFIVL